MMDLFSPALPPVPGLFYFEEYISAKAEKHLCAQISAAAWSHDLKRRVQHYGYRYGYKTRKLHRDSYLGPLPAWLQELSTGLEAEGHFQDPIDQVIVSEYLPGQGLTAHVDCTSCFGPRIASLSLGSGVVMILSSPCGTKSFPLYLAPRSLLLLTGPARWEWQHAIPARKSDKLGSSRLLRGVRFSLTFRSVGARALP